MLVWSIYNNLNAIVTTFTLSCLPHSDSFWLFFFFNICFLGGSAGKESACNVGDLGLIPVLGRSPGGGHSNPLRYSCLENPCGWRSLAGYSAWGHKELDTTEWLNTGQHHLTALNIGCVRTTAADSRTADYIYFAMCRHSSLPGPLGTTVIMMQFISLASFTLRNPAHVPIGGYLCQGIDLEGRS